MFFLFYFCLMIVRSGSVSLTNESGTEGPKTYGSYGSGSRSATLFLTKFKKLFKKWVKWAENANYLIKFGPFMPFLIQQQLQFGGLFVWPPRSLSDLFEL
jgi:hypothetical protein